MLVSHMLPSVWGIFGCCCSHCTWGRGNHPSHKLMGTSEPFGHTLHFVVGVVVAVGVVAAVVGVVVGVVVADVADVAVVQVVVVGGVGVGQAVQRLVRCY